MMKEIIKTENENKILIKNIHPKNTNSKKNAIDTIKCIIKEINNKQV